MSRTFAFHSLVTEEPFELLSAIQSGSFLNQAGPDECLLSPRHIRPSQESDFARVMPMRFS